MIVNIITIAIVDGFQQEVRRKVIGFGAHISIQKLGEGTLIESTPMKLEPAFIDQLKGIKGVESVQPVAYKPALFQSAATDEQREILGVVLKGVGNSYDWSFLKEHLVEGRIPRFNVPASDEILVSRRICRDLHYKLGDTARAYFVKQQPLLRVFKIVGIYETGLEDFDKEMIFCHLPQVQELNDWGIRATVVIDDTLLNGQLIVRGDVAGGNGNYRYDWGEGFDEHAGFTICPVKDTTIRLIAADYWTNINEPTGSTELRDGETAIPDTAYLKITVRGDRYAPCSYALTADKNIIRKYKDDEGFRYDIAAAGKTISVEMIPGKGSSQHYVGSYELMVNDWDQLDALKQNVMRSVMFQPDFQQQVQVKSIRDNQHELFVWLSFLDVNMAIILVLMLVIGMINMGSALLVMILVRTNFIGIMKAMGATDRLIRRVFIVQAGRLIVRGMIWGNVIGVGCCLLQERFGLVSLDPKVYYLNKVPVSMDLFLVLGLNVLTLVICLLAMLIPAIVITRVSPSKAIRFR